MGYIFLVLISKTILPCLPFLWPLKTSNKLCLLMSSGSIEREYWPKRITTSQMTPLLYWWRDEWVTLLKQVQWKIWIADTYGHQKIYLLLRGVRYWEKIICTYIMYFKWSLVRRQLIIRRLLSSRRCNTLTVRFLHTPIISLLNNAVYKKQGLKSLKHYATEGSVKLIANNLQSDVFQITYFKF